MFFIIVLFVEFFVYFLGKDVVLVGVIVMVYLKILVLNDVVVLVKEDVVVGFMKELRRWWKVVFLFKFEFVDIFLVMNEVMNGFVFKFFVVEEFIM